MSTSPVVSVIIPVWNGAALLPETLRSLQSQTFTDFEALIVDDGSTDDTAAVAGTFCQADARLRLVSRPHAGLSATRNAGLELARGEFIAFLDSDDVWLPGKLERQMELFRADPRANFAYTNYYFWDGQQDQSVGYRANRPLPDGDSARRLVWANVYALSSVVVRRATLGRAGGFDPSLDSCEDWDMWLRLAEQDFWARGTREPLVRYRRWPGSMSTKKLKMVRHNLIVLEKNLLATRRPELRPASRQAIRYNRAVLELLLARQSLDAGPAEVPAGLWRAWRHYPYRLKWLMWFGLAAWPKLLGGNATAGIVHRKLIQKF
jgi:glycosyltransferase involved in cell wall biosynthesis